MPDLSPADTAKDAAARAAIALVEDGMRLGLGTGSTAVFMVRRLAERVRAEGLRLRCAATSRATCDLAESLGIRIEELDAIGWLDLTIDGADEIDPISTSSRAAAVRICAKRSSRQPRTGWWWWPTRPRWSSNWARFTCRSR